MMETDSGQPLYTQPQQRDGGRDGVDTDAANGGGTGEMSVSSGSVYNETIADAGVSSLQNNYGNEIMDDNIDTRYSSIFQLADDPSDDDIKDVQVDDCGDGFKLLTQSNELFKQSALNSGCDDASSVGSSDSGSESSSSDSDDDSGSEASSSSDHGSEQKASLTPLQVRRERNIRRNEAFAKSLKFQMNSAVNGIHPGQGGDKGGVKNGKGKRKVETLLGESDGQDKDVDEKDMNQPKRRGMLFTNLPNKQPTIDIIGSPNTEKLPLTTKSLVDELIQKYPHRSKQIHILCSQLVSTVQKSKCAWRRLSRNKQYSEASYQGETRLASPAPILITGSGGTGKTCIVRDALAALQRRTSRGVANAYIDCASSESGTVTAVVNSAYKQLFDSYEQNMSSAQHDKVNANGKAKSRGKHIGTLGGDGFEMHFDSEGESEEANVEDMIERQRMRKFGKSRGRKKATKGTAAKAKGQKCSGHKNARTTRLQTTLATKAASKSVSEKSSGLDGYVQNYTSRNTQASSSVALFGRAMSAIIQAGATKRKSPNDWRCSFVILDNAERILSWNKQGSTSPLTQLFLLPSVMGINLTLIFISRSSIFHYSPVHNPPGALLDAAHPLKVHFDSYNTDKKIKSILRVPHVKYSIIGMTHGRMFNCPISNKLRMELNEFLFSSMIDLFVPIIISTSRDITEIIRLARLLWLEYVAPLASPSDCNDASLKTLRLQVLQYLAHDVVSGSSNGRCESSESSIIRCLPTITNGDSPAEDLKALKDKLEEKLKEKLAHRVRGHMSGPHGLLSNTAMMPGRVLNNQDVKSYVERLPYATKFLLLAAFLCQHKRPDQDVNLFTTKNTGKSKRSRAKKADEGLAYVSSAKEMRLRQPSFPLERLFSVFHSIISQYGQYFVTFKDEGESAASAQLGTERLFQSVSQLISFGLLSSVGKSSDRFMHDSMEMTSSKFSCTISRDSARAIATSVGFPFDKYCL